MDDAISRMTPSVVRAFLKLHPKATPKVWPFQLSSGSGGWIIDAGGGVPARKVTTGWQARPKTQSTSAKSEAPLHSESENERAALLICEYDRQVARIRTQPYTVVHYRDGKKTRTYPDIELVMRNDKRKIVQVKAEKSLEQDEIVQRLERERDAFEACGWTYEIWTDREVKREPRYSNLKKINYFRHRPVDPTLAERVQKFLGSNGPQPISRLLEELAVKEASEATMMSLIRRGIVELDLSKRIDLETQVFLVH